MSRIKIDLPESFSFSTSIPVQITDLNYGAHVGNDKVLSFLHEARVRYLQSLGYTEFNMEGIGLIMSDAALIFKNEMFYGDLTAISFSQQNSVVWVSNWFIKLKKNLKNSSFPLPLQKHYDLL